MYPPQQPPAEQPQPKPKKKASPLLVAVVLAVFVGLCFLGVVLMFNSGGEEEPVDPVADDRSINAEVMCEQFIEERLKAPATADYTDPETSKDGATYTVRGAVDAENSFGAKIRTGYICVVTDNGDDTWKLVDLDLEK